MSSLDLTTLARPPRWHVAHVIHDFHSTTEAFRISMVPHFHLFRTITMSPSYRHLTKPTTAPKTLTLHTAPSQHGITQLTQNEGRIPYMRMDLSKEEVR